MVLRWFQVFGVGKSGKRVFEVFFFKYNFEIKKTEKFKDFKTQNIYFLHKYIRRKELNKTFTTNLSIILEKS